MEQPLPKPSENISTDDARVREHLANERTYLAWLRTGIAMMGFGVVLAKLRYVFSPGTLTAPAAGIIHAADLGLLLTVIGLSVVIFSALRFQAVQRQIREGRFQASSAFVLIFTSLIAILGLLALWYLLESSRASSL